MVISMRHQHIYKRYIQTGILHKDNTSGPNTHVLLLGLYKNSIDLLALLS